MDSKALVHLNEISFSWQQMKTIPREHLAALSILSYAVTETNALSRIYLCQSHKYINQKAIDSATNVHRFLVIRTWSSKLFEIERFLQFGGKKPLTTDKKLNMLADDALRKLAEISKGEGFEIAKNIRNEAANHYSFSAALRNIENVSESADCTMYLHDQSGNCFYPMGEEVMFHARLNRRWRNHNHETRDRYFKEWLDWNIAANTWLAEVHAKFSCELLFKPMNGVTARKKVYWIPKEFVGRHTDRFTPVFFSRPEANE